MADISVQYWRLLAHTILFLTMENGMMATSPAFHSHRIKIVAATPEPTNKPMMTEEFHAYVPPEPNWRARSSRVAAGAKTAKPMRSSCGITRRMRAREKGALTICSGHRVNTKNAAAMAPNRGCFRIKFTWYV